MSPSNNRTAMSPAVVVMALTLLLGIQPIATDLYLPALPTIATSLGTTVSAAQLTLSALAISFGIAQLICGPLSDRFGRRPVVLIGLALFTLASIGSALAPRIEWLVGMRALQGAAMAASVTCGRSIVRDLYEPHQGARVMSRGLTGLGFLAVLSPIVGGLTVAYIGWRSSVLAPGVFSFCALVFCFLRYEETVPSKNPHATRFKPLLQNWVLMARHPTFIAYAALGAATYSGLFLLLISSSFIYINVLGASRLEYGAIMAGNSVAYTLGTVLCRRLLVRFGLRRTVGVAACFSLFAGLALILLSLAGVLTIWAVLLPQLVYAVGHGVHQPCTQVGAVGPFPRAAGTASALSGFFMMAAAFGTGLLAAEFFNGTVYPLTIGVAIAGMLVALISWTLVRWHGEQLAPVPVADPA